MRSLRTRPRPKLKRAASHSIDVPLATSIAHTFFRAPNLDAISGADINILGHNLDEKSKVRLMALTTETHGFRIHGPEVFSHHPSWGKGNETKKDPTRRVIELHSRQ
jgi:hypothetical protein